jgi:hypothetical protein
MAAHAAAGDQAAVIRLLKEAAYPGLVVWALARYVCRLTEALAPGQNVLEVLDTRAGDTGRDRVN